jgi:hypothetical protein
LAAKPVATIKNCAVVVFSSSHSIFHFPEDKSCSAPVTLLSNRTLFLMSSLLVNMIEICSQLFPRWVLPSCISQCGMPGWSWRPPVCLLYLPMSCLMLAMLRNPGDAEERRYSIETKDILTCDILHEIPLDQRQQQYMTTAISHTVPLHRSSCDSRAWVELIWHISTNITIPSRHDILLAGIDIHMRRCHP